MTSECRLLLVCGSLRAASTNAAVLRTAVAVAPPGTSVTESDVMAELPHFNPDDDIDPLPSTVVRLRSAVDAADALLISTPEYAGTLPGSFKNLLDWSVGGTEISRKPVAWINASATSGAPGAHAALRTVLGYVDADIVEAACAHVPVPHGAAGPEGTVDDPTLRARIASAVRALVEHVAVSPRV